MSYRSLKSVEITQLQFFGNYVDDWSLIKVSDNFDASLIRNNVFMGRVWIGVANEGYVHDGDLQLPVGIYNSYLSDVTIGDDCAIHNVHMLRGYRIGDHCLLFNIDEMTATPLDENNKYPHLEPMNECGGRWILPFPGMTIGDAYLWAKYRDHKVLTERLEHFACQRLATPEGCYGQVGSYAVIKNTRTLHNAAVLSDKETPSRVDSCVALVDGVVGYGCTCEYGCIAMRFLLGEHVHLEFGVRLNDTVVGDNSTIARCEVGNNIIFPAHEQHHNNSFLIASLVMGQSNMAAGCTVGSNHNGRTADNEIVAGRGFWPGLCTSLKHSSAFASYTLLAKGSYPSELSITLPFALVNNNVSKNCLEVMPAYWWMYNMYALNRNMTKFAKRDKRKKRVQHIVFDPLAPDTAEEIINGRMLLKSWIEQAYLQFDKDKEHLEVCAFGMEKGKRKTVILKWKEGYQAYEDMLVYYAMNILTQNDTIDTLPEPLPEGMEREREWVNLGGQLVPQHDVDSLIAAIEQGTVASWEQVHACYDEWWSEYASLRQRHAYQTLCLLSERRNLNEELWQQYRKRYKTILHFVEDEIKITREKDNTNPYRRMTYRNDKEMDAVLE